MAPLSLLRRPTAPVFDLSYHDSLPRVPPGLCVFGRHMLMHVPPRSWSPCDHTQSNINASGLMAPYGGYWGYLGDWLTPHGSELSGSPESVLFNNCILVFALRIAAKVA